MLRAPLQCGAGDASNCCSSLTRRAFGSQAPAPFKGPQLRKQQLRAELWRSRRPLLDRKPEPSGSERHNEARGNKAGCQTLAAAPSTVSPLSTLRVEPQRDLYLRFSFPWFPGFCGGASLVGRACWSCRNLCGLPCFPSRAEATRASLGDRAAESLAGARARARGRRPQVKCLGMVFQPGGRF